MKKCMSCGKQFPEEASFCMHCMTPLSPVMEVVNAPIRKKEKTVSVGLLTTICLAAAVSVAFLLGRFSTVQPLLQNLQKTEKIEY